MAPYDLDRGSSGIAVNATKERVDKDLTVNSRIRLRHYYINEYVITDVVEVFEYNFKLKINDEMVHANMFPGDQITAYFINESKQECVINGVIEDVQASFPQFFLVKAVRIERFSDARKNRRYAINACCNIIDGDSKAFGIIKNMSLSGIRMFSKAMIENRKNIKIQIFIDKNTSIDLNVGITRKKQMLNYNEYGLVVLRGGENEWKEFGEIIKGLSEKESNNID